MIFVSDTGDYVLAKTVESLRGEFFGFLLADGLTCSDFRTRRKIASTEIVEVKRCASL